ncbi:hypothetical protein GWI33_016244 [Rhynchophorus ferrugineus]|uniref:Clip domain-containing protein n=1 Tax=Rhynchophorus ferrugineus TaxID=354439 RepID=A0A834M561_RHYFE|nr:hypothetical protein GWI33_016244 [Rhynchophorus ferrugineus]
MKYYMIYFCCLIFGLTEAQHYFNTQGIPPHLQPHNRDDEIVYGLEPQFGEQPNALTTVLRKGYITIGGKTYDLGRASNIPATESCNNPFIGSSGKCSIITECPELLVYKRTVEQYAPHFCKIGRYAGVCCPPQSFYRQ